MPMQKKRKIPKRLENYIHPYLHTFHKRWSNKPRKKLKVRKSKGLTQKSNSVAGHRPPTPFGRVSSLLLKIRRPPPFGKV